MTVCEFKLANMEHNCEKLAYLRYLVARKLQFSQSSFEVLKPVRIVDAYLQLSRMPEVFPSLLACLVAHIANTMLVGGSCYIFETKMLLLSVRGSRQKIVEGVKVSFSSGNVGNARSFETMVKQLGTN
jgi:hypothetical protein